MPAKRKNKSRPVESPPPDPIVLKSSATQYTTYISVVGVHSTSLAFTALFLPRSTFLQDFPVDPSQLSSKDRPQPEFLDALTRNPIVTLLCLCAGTAVLQGWYAGYIRQWWITAFVTGSDDEVRAKRKTLDDKKLAVRALSLRI